MTPEELCGELEHLLTQLGIEVRLDTFDEESNFTSGLCTLRGKTILFISQSLKTHEKINLIIQFLQTRDLEGIYIKPYVRELIESGSAPT